MPEKEHDIEIQIDIVNIAYVLRGFAAIRELKEFLDEHASLVVSHSRIRDREEIALTPSELPFPSAAPPETEPLRASDDGTPEPFELGGSDPGEPPPDGGNGDPAQVRGTETAGTTIPTPDTQTFERGGGAEAA